MKREFDNKVTDIKRAGDAAEKSSKPKKQILLDERLDLFDRIKQIERELQTCS